MGFYEAVEDIVYQSDFMAELIGHQPDSIFPLQGGTISAVYRVDLPDGSSCVVKFGEDAHELQFEQAFLSAWDSHGVRTPEVHRFAPLPDHLSGGVLLMEFIEGRNLLEIMDQGEVSESERIMTDLGRILATIHQVKAVGFGFPAIDDTDNIKGTFASLPRSFQSQEWQTAIDANLRNNDLLENELRLVEKAVDILNDHLAGGGGSLIHGDFRAGNILYDPASMEPYTVIDPHPEISHPYLCLAYALILPEIYDAFEDSTFIQKGYDAIAPLDAETLHAARFLKALELMPRWGQPGHHLEKALKNVFQEEKRWLIEMG